MHENNESGHHYCGSIGRQARAIARNEEDERTPMSAKEAARHIEGCPHCQKKIGDMIQKNPDTTYPGTVEETLIDIKYKAQREQDGSSSLLSSRWWQ